MRRFVSVCKNAKHFAIICKYTDKNTKTKEWRKWTLAVVAVRFLENGCSRPQKNRRFSPLVFA